MQADHRGTCITNPMSELGNRIKSARAARDMSQGQLAKAAGNLAYQTIQDLENGKSKGSKHILAIAQALGVDADWLQYGRGSQSAQPGHPRVLQESSQQYRNEDRLPVLGMAECGPDGWSLWNGDIIDTIPRPANLFGAPNAYAVYIAGESMAPRYHPGELVHIHPGRPVTIGAYVLVQMKEKDAGDGPKAVVKRLSKRSATKITLEQFNPHKVIEIKADEVVSMHRVVGASEA